MRQTTIESFVKSHHTTHSNDSQLNTTEVEEGKLDGKIMNFIAGGVGVDCYYTKLSVLKDISSLVKPYLEKNITFVDFSCGKNEFAPLLGCPFLAFDVSAAPNATVADWLKVSKLPNDIAIGLNPPFGYQGQIARKFIEHALKFSPRYMFLILPNMRWQPPGYEIVYSKELAEDSFYDPTTNKSYKEISTTFTIFKKSFKSVDKPTKIHEDVPGVIVTRKFMSKKFPFIILRRVGRNTTKQFYCVTGTGDANCTYIENGEMMNGITWNERHNNHSKPIL